VAIPSRRGIGGLPVAGRKLKGGAERPTFLFMSAIGAHGGFARQKSQSGLGTVELKAPVLGGPALPPQRRPKKKPTGNSPDQKPASHDAQDLRDVEDYNSSLASHGGEDP
jgi:hypothetical protein